MTKESNTWIWKVALIFHTSLVAIMFAVVIYYWDRSRGESAYDWLLLGIIDLPAAVVFLVVDAICANLGVSGYFRYTALPFVIFTVVGGAQWFLIFHRRSPAVEFECEQCGYDLRASLEIGRCPECGMQIEECDSIATNGETGKRPKY